MKKRRPRTPQPTPLKERLMLFAKETRAKAVLLPEGPERDELLRKAGQADTASHLDEWIASSGLRPPAK